MSKLPAGCAGWGVAGFFGLMLLGKCMGDAPDQNTPPARFAATPAPAAAVRHEYVQPRSANCRAEASTQASVVAKLDQRDYVGIVREENGWSLIDRAPRCWVRSDLVGSRMPAYPPARPQRAHSSSGGGSGNSSAPRRSRRYSDSGCPCSGNNVCIGPRGGRYCITSGGNKRYGV